MGRDLWLQGVAISSLTVALAIVGAYLTLCFNLNQAVSRLAAGPAMTAAIKDEASPAQIQALLHELSRRPEVQSVVFIDKNQAIQRFARQLGPHRGLLEGIERNPLPNAVEITLRPGIRPLDSLLANLEKRPEVQEVVTSRPWLHRLDQAAGVMRDLSAGLGLLLFAGVVFLVINTVRLAVYLRREQLEVMDLVGASAWYVRLPFLLEALLQALIASGLASLLIWGILFSLSAPASLPLGLNMRDILAMPPLVPPALAGLAVLAALLGGLIGVGRALKLKGI
jgi:cell division transport system permease protein